MEYVLISNKTKVGSDNLNALGLNVIKIKPEQLDFFIDIYGEQYRKELEGKLKDEKTIEWLKDKLIEERGEVDECIINEDAYKLINEELLHEAIMCMLLRDKLIKHQTALKKIDPNPENYF